MKLRKCGLAFVLAAATAISLPGISTMAEEPDPSQTPVADIPEEYIREQMEKIESGEIEDVFIRVKVLESAQIIPAEILGAIGEQDMGLTVSVYESDSDQYPAYEWTFNGITSGLEATQEDFDIGVEIDSAEVYNGVDSVVADDAAFTTFSLDCNGNVPTGAILCMPASDETAMYEMQNVYGYNRGSKAILDFGGGAGFGDSYSNGWWMSVRLFQSGVRDYIMTPSELEAQEIYQDSQHFSDIGEAEKQIQAGLSQGFSEINISMENYYGNDYVLSSDTLQAVRDAGAELNITFPGAEASKTYRWIFHGKEMSGEIPAVDLTVRFPYDDETAEKADQMITNDVEMCVLDFQHSGSLPAGTDFTTLFSLDRRELAGTQGYLYYLNEDSGTLELVSQTGFYLTDHQGMEAVYVSLNDLSHCSAYVVTDKMAEGPKVDNTVSEPDPGPQPDPDPESRPDNPQVQTPEGDPSGGDVQGAGTDEQKSPVNRTEAPRTGDSSRTGILVLLLAAGGGAILLSGMKKVKNGR